MIDLFKQIDIGIKTLNNSSYFAGILMIILNIGAKFITIELSPTQESFIKNNIGRQILIFSIIWMGTKNIYTSLILTAIFIILSDFILNENSNFCILPERWIDIKNKIDIDNDGFISDKEIEQAIKVLNKTKQQKKVITKQKNYINFKKRIYDK